MLFQKNGLGTINRADNRVVAFAAAAAVDPLSFDVPSKHFEKRSVQFVGLLFVVGNAQRRMRCRMHGQFTEPHLHVLVFGLSRTLVKRFQSIVVQTFGPCDLDKRGLLKRNVVVGTDGRFCMGVPRNVGVQCAMHHVLHFPFALPFKEVSGRRVVQHGSEDLTVRGFCEPCWPGFGFGCRRFHVGGDVNTPDEGK